MALIRNIFHEDHDCNIDFFYTGKSNVLGLTHPDCSLLNDKNYYYIRIGLITYEESLLSTDEITINEEFTVAEETETSEDAANSKINKVQIYGVVRGGRALPNTFRCLCTPILGDSEVIDIHLTEDQIITDGVSRYALGIWLNTKDMYKIYVSSDVSHSRESAPLNEEHLDSKYYLSYLKNSEIESSTNTTNVFSQISNRRFCVGKNINADVLKRLDNLEAVALPKFQYCYVTYDEGFTPVYAGDESKNYQVIAPSGFQYSLMNCQSFTKFNTDRESLSVTENGTYVIQLSSGITGGNGITEKSDVEISVFVDDTKVPMATIKKTITGDSTDICGGNMAVVDLTTNSKIRVKMKFGNNIGDSVVNEGTYLSILRIL